MKKYEYRLLNDEFGNEDKMLDALNSLADEGWRVVTGSFRDVCEQYTSSDCDYYTKGKFLLEREIFPDDVTIDDAGRILLKVPKRKKQ